MIRALVALPLPESVRSALTVTQFLLPLPRPVPRQNLHVTLAFLGSLSEPDLGEVDAALVRLRAAPSLSVIRANYVTSAPFRRRKRRHWQYSTRSDT